MSTSLNPVILDYIDKLLKVTFIRAWLYSILNLKRYSMSLRPTGLNRILNLTLTQTLN